MMQVIAGLPGALIIRKLFGSIFIEEKDLQRNCQIEPKNCGSCPLFPTKTFLEPTIKYPIDNTIE